MTWGAAASFLLLLYGSLLLWVGFRLGSRQVQPPALLRMPAGIILAAICLCCGIFFGMLAAKKFSEENRVWRKFLLAAIAWLGRHSLLLYLLHQPVIYGALWAAARIFGWPEGG